MNNQETVDQLNELKLNGMATAFEAMLNMPLQARPTVEQAVAKMVEVEKDYRRNKRTALFLKGSKLRYNAVLEEVLCSTSRNFTKDQLYALADCGFIRRNENLFIQGKCGCGKSFLACAIGHQACFLGYRTMYYNMNRFVEKIMVSKLDGTLLKFIESMGKYQLLILDDFGLQPMDDNTRLTLLQILEDRYDKASTIVVSQLPIDQWYDYLGEPATIADAIMDRLVSNVNKIELKGESLRRKKGK